MNRTLRVVLCLGTLVGVVCNSAAAAPILYESASLGPTGQNGGATLWANQFLGVRFDVSIPVITSTVGGHIDGFTGTLFAALVALTSANDFPDTANLTSSDVLGSAVFTPPAVSADVSVPLSVTLVPGHYALVFGGGDTLGATGIGSMPAVDTNIGTPSYFLRTSAGTYADTSLMPGARFFVTADPVGPIVPEPASMLLLGTGLAGLALRRHRRSRS